MLLLQFPQLSIDAHTDGPTNEAATILVEWIAAPFDRDMNVIQIDKVRQSIFFQGHNVAELRFIRMDE